MKKKEMFGMGMAMIMVIVIGFFVWHGLTRGYSKASFLRTYREGKKIFSDKSASYDRLVLETTLGYNMQEGYQLQRRVYYELSNGTKIRPKKGELVLRSEPKISGLQLDYDGRLFYIYSPPLHTLYYPKETFVWVESPDGMYASQKVQIRVYPTFKPKKIRIFGPKKGKVGEKNYFLLEMQFMNQPKYFQRCYGVWDVVFSSIPLRETRRTQEYIIAYQPGTIRFRARFVTGKGKFEYSDEFELVIIEKGDK